MSAPPELPGLNAIRVSWQTAADGISRPRRKTLTFHPIRDFGVPEGRSCGEMRLIGTSASTPGTFGL
jgi:hypothetical protein